MIFKSIDHLSGFSFDIDTCHLLQMLEIKKNTEIMTLYSRLRDLKPKGGGSLQDAVSEITKRLESKKEIKNSFISASELLKETSSQAPKSSRKDINKKVSSVNPDPLMQMKMDSYCIKADAYSDEASIVCKEENASNYSESEHEFACEEYDEEEVMQSDNEEIFHDSYSKTTKIDKDLECQDDEEDIIEINADKNKQKEDEKILIKLFDDSDDEMMIVEAENKEETNEVSKPVVSENGYDRNDIKQNPSTLHSFDLFGCDTAASKAPEIKFKISGKSSKEECRQGSTSKNYNKQNKLKDEEKNSERKRRPSFENFKIHSPKKRKLSRDLFGDSDDELPDVSSKKVSDSIPELFGECSRKFERKEKRNLKEKEFSSLKIPNNNCNIKKGKEVNSGSSAAMLFSDSRKEKTHQKEKVPLPLKNTSNNCNVKKVCVNVMPVKQKPEDELKKADDSPMLKKDLAQRVVAYLMPFYGEKRIASKDLFKYLARKMTHHLESLHMIGKCK